MAKRKLKHSAHPSYWPIWLGLGAAWLMTRLPYKSQLRIGRILGYAAMMLSKRTRRITEINLEKCFPHLSIAERKILLKKNFASTGMGVIETIMSWWGKFDDDRNFMTVHNIEYLNNAIANGRSAILLCPHLSSLEICGRLAQPQLNIAVLYNKFKHPLLEKINFKHLNQTYQKAIPRENIRDVVRCLRKNIPVFFTPDIDPAMHGGVFAQFFGVNAYSLTATAKLAKISKADILPVSFFRRSDYSGYDLTLHPPLSQYPSGDEQEDARKINQMLEEIINQHPEQYFWQYKRFKTRPSGEGDYYVI